MVVLEFARNAAYDLVQLPEVYVVFDAMLRSLLSKIEWRLRPFLLVRPAAPDTVELGSGPVVVVGLLGTASGIGQSARVCAQGLRKQGVEVSTIDLSKHFSQRDITAPQGRSHLPNVRAGTVIIHVNPPEFERALFLIKCYRRRGWRVIGYWVWELPVVPAEWARAGKYVSEIWTPSDFASIAFRHMFQCPVTTVPHAIFPPAELEEAITPVCSQSVRFLTLADGRSSLFRKGALNAIKAFQAAFPNGEPHTLTLKCRDLDVESEIVGEVRGLIKQDHRISLVETNMKEDEKWNLIARHDVIFSPHRSEGFGLVLAEAMALGKTVMATGWSGNMTFMTQHNSILLPYHMVAVEDPTGIYAMRENVAWASPYMDATIEAMRHIAANPNVRTALREQAKKDISALNGAAYLEALNAYSALR